MTERLRWGILSTARIGDVHVVPALLAAPNCEVVAVGSRDFARARDFADRHGIERAYGDYGSLLVDDGVDAIYNPLPNHLHGPLTRQAATAGKHVLCEKPFTLDRAEGEALVADLATLAAGAPAPVSVMEAFMYQFHPQWQAVFEMVGSGRIGTPVAVQTWFSYFGDDPANIRHNPDWGGGAMMDIGCYAIHSARRIFGTEPSRARGSVTIHPDYGVDVVGSAVLDFRNGQATFTVATQSDPAQQVTIVGTDGRIVVSRPFNAQADRPMVVRVGAGMGADYGEPLEELAFGPADQYSIMAQRFAAAVLAGEPAPVGLDDAVANMAVIDDLFRSAGAD